MSSGFKSDDWFCSLKLTFFFFKTSLSLGFFLPTVETLRLSERENIKRPFSPPQCERAQEPPASRPIKESKLTCIDGQTGEKGLERELEERAVCLYAPGERGDACLCVCPAWEPEET